MRGLATFVALLILLPQAVRAEGVARSFLLASAQSSASQSVAAPNAALTTRTPPPPVPQTPAVNRVPLGPLGDRVVTVLDHASHAIIELYISPQSADAWGADLLGDEVMDVGTQRPFKLGKMRDCGFDLLAVYDDLSREEMRGVNLCKSKQMAFDGSHATVPPDLLAPQHSVLVIDRTPMPIQQLFISPQDAAQWGDDLLVTSAMSVGEQRNVTFRGPCIADVRVVFANRAAEERHGLDLCALSNLRVAPGWTTMDMPTGSP